MAVVIPVVDDGSPGRGHHTADRCPGALWPFGRVEPEGSGGSPWRGRRGGYRRASRCPRALDRCGDPCRHAAPAGRQNGRVTRRYHCGGCGGWHRATAGRLWVGALRSKTACGESMLAAAWKPSIEPRTGPESDCSRRGWPRPQTPSSPSIRTCLPWAERARFHAPPPHRPRKTMASACTRASVRVDTRTSTGTTSALPSMTRTRRACSGSAIRASRGTFTPRPVHSTGTVTSRASPTMACGGASMRTRAVRVSVSRVGTRARTATGCPAMVTVSPTEMCCTMVSGHPDVHLGPIGRHHAQQGLTGAHPVAGVDGALGDHPAKARSRRCSRLASARLASARRP